MSTIRCIGLFAMGEVATGETFVVEGMYSGDSAERVHEFPMGLGDKHAYTYEKYHQHRSWEKIGAGRKIKNEDRLSLVSHPSRR